MTTYGEDFQQDVQSIQVLAGVVILVSALMTIAFGVAVSLLVKGILFLLVQVIVCIGLWQTVHRAYTSLTIAAYLRTFVEPKTARLKWENEVEKLPAACRGNIHHLHFGVLQSSAHISLFNHRQSPVQRRLTVIYELRLLPYIQPIYLDRTWCSEARTICRFLWTSLRINRRYSANSGAIFSNAIWKEA